MKKPVARSWTLAERLAVCFVYGMYCVKLGLSTAQGVNSRLAPKAQSHVGKNRDEHNTPYTPPAPPISVKSPCNAMRKKMS